MTSHASRFPFALDPLIAEAKRRARRRRFSLVLALTGVAAVAISLALGLRPGGHAKPLGGSAAGGSVAQGFYRVGWTIPADINGHHVLDLTVRWFRVASGQWSAGVAVRNRSKHLLRPITRGTSGWGLEVVANNQMSHPRQCNGSTCRGLAASSFEPELPRTLVPRAHWSGVVSGSGRVPKHWWVTFDLGSYRGWPRYAGGSGFGFGPTLYGVHIH